MAGDDVAYSGMRLAFTRPLRTSPLARSPRLGPFVAALLAPFALAVAGCDLGAVGLGSDETDAFRLLDTAAGNHLAQVLEGGDALTFQDVIEGGDNIVFTDTPVPQGFLRAQNTVDDDRNRHGRGNLSVLSYNVALLDVDLLGIIPYAETPDLDRRRRTLPGLVFETGADVILLQEVWLEQDVERFIERGEEAGYEGFVQARTGHNDGLLSFVKKSAMAGGSSTEVDFAAYGSQVGTEYFPGPGIQRGWLSVRFTHAEVGPITAFNTHMQAFPENWLGRMKQAREVGIILRQIQEESGDLVLFAGDLNAAPYYKKATWDVPGGATQDRWFHNTFSYSTLLTYGDLLDAVIMGRSANDAIADITLGDTVVNNADTALDIPGAEDGWCGRTPNTTFTATDCNSLYFDQYAGTEYPARLDHIFVSDRNGRVVVTGSEILFTKKLQFGDLSREPSDHFGVMVRMLVTPK